MVMITKSFQSFFDGSFYMVYTYTLILFIDGSYRLGEAHFLVSKCCCVHKDKIIDLEDVVNITNIRWRSRIFVF